MVIKSCNAIIEDSAIVENLDRITNQIFKLLPSREEGVDWKSPLENIILEIAGMSELLDNQRELFSLLCKLQGMMTLTEEDDFLLFRKGVFECLGLIGEVKKCQA